MKLGLTTNIFSEALTAGEVNLGGLVDFAEEEGFAAIEVRDDGAVLGRGELAGFVKDADAKSVRISYAIKNDMLQDGDERLFRRAVDLAALCGEGTILRILASQTALAAQGKKGYTFAEVDEIARIARRYARLAGEKDVILAIEHARDPLYGDGATYFGLHDIFAAIEKAGDPPANLGVTFDPANAVFTSLCKVPTTPERVLGFIAEHSRNIALVHYKTTSGGEPTPVITDGDIDGEKLFEELSKVYDGTVCLEIPPAGDLAECRKNITASLEYMLKKGLMGYFAQKGAA